VGPSSKYIGRGRNHPMRSRRSRFALLGILVLAFSVGATMTIGGVAAAQKKKKGGGGSKTFNKGGGPIPDASFPATPTSNGGEFHRGLLSSKVTVGRKFAGVKIKDLNVQVAATHQRVSDLLIQLVGPNGRLVTLFDGTENNMPGTVGPPYFSGGRLGPTTFDDQAALFIDDSNSCPTGPDAAFDCFGTPDGGNVEAFAPYAGSYKPADGTLGSLGNKLQGTWVLLVFDLDAPFGGDPAATGSLTNWRLIAQLRGGGKKKKK
jgi:subtilisin-like proprotein convertase family protein